MCAAAEALQKAGGEAGIDYLVMCQKGLPTGTINENADGWAVQLRIYSSQLILSAQL
jgi:hypothetical protein